MRVRLRALGRFEFFVGDVALAPLPTQKARALLAYLSLNNRLETPRERLIEIFWSEFEPARAREGLRTALSTIRRALREAGADADAVIASDRTFIRLNLIVDTDVNVLEACARSDAELDWRAAVDVYAGDFLDGNYEEWAIAQREHYAALYESVLARLVRTTADTKAARLLLTRNPYDEGAYATLLESELKAQRLTAARELFARYRAAMSEAAVEPSHELMARFASLDAPVVAEITLPFVAREAELAILERGMATLCEGRPYAAILLGEPGIGKSALLKRAGDLARRVGCDAFSVRVAEDASIAAVWGALYRRLTGASPEKVAATAADVPALIASTIARRISQPAIVFVDDAHAMRGDALATLVELTHIAGSASFGLVVAMRPEGLSGVGKLLAPYIGEQITLGPLLREDVDTALTLTLANPTPRLSAALFARSGGYPLFLVSLLESLVRDKTVDRDRGRWRLRREPGERLELPQDLRASIDARLRAAGDDAAVVACALALEPSATADDLAVVLGYEESVVLDALDGLLRFALIGEAARGYRFHFLHDVVREVAAVLLNAGRRVALHREFARLYTQNPHPEARVKLAIHLQAAGMMTQAARAYIDAARASIDSYAFHDALQCCSDGTACFQHVPPSPNLQVLQAQVKVLVAEAAVQTGAFDVASAAAEDAVRAARSAGEPATIANALIMRATLRGVLGEPAQPFADAEEGLRLSVETENTAIAARACVRLSAMARFAGSSSDAKQFAVEGGASAGVSSDRATEYAAAEELIRAHVSWWQFPEAAKEILRARPIAEAAGALAQARLECITAWFHSSIERFAEANRALAEAEFLVRGLAARRDGAPPDPAYPLVLARFTLHYLTGVVALAEERCDRALEAANSCRGVAPLSSLGPYRDAAVRLDLCARLKMGTEIPRKSPMPRPACRFTCFLRQTLSHCGMPPPR